MGNIHTSKYLVSVYMTTYFHEKYIRQAIDSILCQQVDFPYEIVISDDCSLDGTREILNEYNNRYDFIRVNFNETNIGLSNNMFLAKCMCSGKYIIPLSGDDYWIDRFKLQRQVDFLESHPQYIGVTTRLEARSDETKKSLYTEPSIGRCEKKFTIHDYLEGNNFPMNGLLMRNVIQDNFDMFSMMPRISRYIDDITDCLFILSLGDVYILSDVTVAYRLRLAQNGEHNFNSINTGISKFEKVISLLNGLDKYLDGKYNLIHRYAKVVGAALGKYYRPRFSGKFKEIMSTIPRKYYKNGLIILALIYIPKKGIKSVVRRLIR